MSVSDRVFMIPIDVLYIYNLILFFLYSFIYVWARALKSASGRAFMMPIDVVFFFFVFFYSLAFG